MAQGARDKTPLESKGLHGTRASPEGAGDAVESRERLWKQRCLCCTLIAVITLTSIFKGQAWVSSHWKSQHGCEIDYWKPHCRLERGDLDSYRNFLARAGLLMPPVIHATILPEKLFPGRLLIIGDVHGCIEELHMLLDKCKYVQGEDNLIFVGDLGDKGPHSIEVIKEIRRLGALSVRGNHDDTALAAYEAMQRGEKITKKKHEWVKHLTEAEARWLSLLPWTISIPVFNIIIVHAGLVPEIPLENQLLIDLYRMRELEPGSDTKWHGLEAKVDRGEGIPWAEVWSGPQHIVFGHDRQKGLQEEAFATGIDTGAVYGNYLTGLLFPKVSAVQAVLAQQNTSQPLPHNFLAPEIIQVKSKQRYV